MKIDINTRTGFYAEGGSDEVNVQGMDMKNYVFDYAWDDLQGTIHGVQGTGQAGLTYEQYRDTPFSMDFFRHDQSDTLNIVYQMTHMWDSTTGVWPHIHVIPMASGSGNAYFEYSYSWLPINAELPVSASWTVGYKATTFTPEDQFKHKIVSFVTSSIMPPEGAGASTMLFIKMTRLGNSPQDTYSTNKAGGGGATAQANLGIVAADIHYQKIKAGTGTQFY